MTDIEIIEGYDKIEEVSILFKDYAKWLGLDLSFQNFNSELDSLPGKYSIENGGRLYIAKYQGKLAGCIALRKIDITINNTIDEAQKEKEKENICEMKRLYVKSEFRGFKIGKLLVERLIQDSKEQNYQYMVLDTLKTLTTAVTLYKSYGFIEFEPYYYNPNDVYFLKLKL